MNLSIQSESPRYATTGILVLASFLGSCSSGGGDDQGPGGEDLEQLVSQLRGVITAQSIQPVPDAPSLSADLVELGRALYFDKEISGNRDVSCATCHLASRAGSDARTLPSGVGGSGLGPDRLAGAMVPRHSPVNLNSFHGQAMFWDGRVEFRPPPGGGPPELMTPAGVAMDATITGVFTPGLETLAAQAILPPTSRAEMRGEIGESELGDIVDGNFTEIWDAIVARLVSFPAYVGMFQDAYPGLLVGDIHIGHVGNALAAFEASELQCTDSPFQAFLEGDDLALTATEIRGALEFFSPASRCTVCHSGPFFSDFNFHNIGLPQLGPGKGNGLGSNDDFGRENVTGLAQDRYKFRTPSLLNVALTGPYGHAGQYSTLSSIVAHYRNVATALDDYNIMDHVTNPDLIATQVANQTEVLANLAPSLANPLQFSVTDVTAFLESLSATDALDLSGIVPPSVPSGHTIDL
ncbi:Cytochrome c551 peroxidase precursor [Planctomycetes bacterium Poly30]|uniref:Cytochrome c551 peroxidase n=1 Tax=Saltatorellus ferox TaxID=2528018 RepID=A0A518EVA1_9BACT|nr:Cytochrome c551 peroxidase precursor [Planctomycetes bacterium Poly30]